MKKIDALVPLTGLLFLIVSACGGDPRTARNEGSAPPPAPWDLIDEGELPPPSNSPVHVATDSNWNALEPATDTATDTARIQLPEADEGDANYAPDSVQPFTARQFRALGRLAEVFNDSNKYQYAAGERIGIKPINSIADAYFLKRPMVKVRSCQWYNVEPLTHSVPYLVPEAAALLETIGRNFRDSMARRGISGHKMRVTSVLRTARSVKKLRRINGNATDSSTHKLGTTFDISYARFDHDGKSPRHSDEELKYILAEVLRDLRSENKCLVKFERKSPCFHITATGR